jgi:hypothetical protein
MIIKNTERNSEAKNRLLSSRTFAALIVSISMLSAAIMLSAMRNDSFAQGSNTSTTASLLQVEVRQQQLQALA